MNSLHVVQLHACPIFQQLQLEEALLRADSHNWCLINTGSPPAIVMGISGKASELINPKKMIQMPVPIIRRFSGGGTVFIDEDTYFVTFICNTSFAPVHPFPEHIMRWTEQFYRPLFHPHPFCLQENDYVLHKKKFGGNAQSICKQRWLHHTSLLWDYTPNNMDYLKLPQKMPAYREQRPHTDFLCSLKALWADKNDFKNQLLKQLDQQFVVKEIKLEEINEILKRPHRQATTLIDWKAE